MSSEELERLASEQSFDSPGGLCRACGDDKPGAKGRDRHERTGVQAGPP